MEWFNIRLAILRSPEFVGSEPTERSTWLCVSAFCVDQENGGRIAGAATWKDRQWQQTCGVTAREVRAASRLLAIEGADVVVFAYPVEKQAEVQAKRKQAGEAARKRWDRGAASETQSGRNASRMPNGSPESDATSDASRIPPRNASRHAPRDAEGEREREGERNPPQTPKPGGGVIDDFRPRLTLPPALAANPAFVACLWDEWLPYLVQRKAGRTPTIATLEAHLKVCARMSPERAVAALRSAIEKDFAAPDEAVRLVSMAGAGRPWDEAPDDWKAWWRDTYPPEDFPDAPRYEDGEWSDVTADHRKHIWEGLQKQQRRSA